MSWVGRNNIYYERLYQGTVLVLYRLPRVVGLARELAPNRFANAIRGLLLVGRRHMSSVTKPKPNAHRNAQLDPSSAPSVWQDGPLEVRSFTIATEDFEAPTQMDIHYPTATLTRFEFPLYIFHHGFLSQPEDYRTLLRRIASHGIITVAPRAYPRMSGLLTSVNREVALSREVRRWIFAGGIARAVAADGGTAKPATDLPPAIGGHSRGGGIAFLSSETVSCCTTLARSSHSLSTVFDWLQRCWSTLMARSVSLPKQRPWPRSSHTQPRSNLLCLRTPASLCTCLFCLCAGDAQ